MKRLKPYRFPLLLLASVVTGSVAGWFLGPQSAVLKPLGDIFLNLLFTVVVPLVFVTISSSIANMGTLKRLGRIMGTLLVVFTLTGIIASVVMLFSVQWFNPGEGVSVSLGQEKSPEEPLTLSEQIVQALTAPDFKDLLSKENMLALILFAMLFGTAVSMSGESGKTVARGLAALSDVLVKLIGVIMWFAPVGLASYFASLVGEFGPSLVGSYLKAVAIYYPVAILYFLVFFSLYAWVAAGRTGFRKFWANIFPAAGDLTGHRQQRGIHSCELGSVTENRGSPGHPGDGDPDGSHHPYGWLLSECHSEDLVSVRFVPDAFP